MPWITRHGCVCVCVKGRGEDIKLFRTYLNCRIKNKTKTDVSENKKKTVLKKPTTQNNNNPTKNKVLFGLTWIFRAQKKIWKDHNNNHPEFTDKHL